MIRRLLSVAVVAILLGSVGMARADAPAGEQKPGMSEEQFLSSLHFQSGKVDLPGGVASLDLPPTFRYLNPADSNRVLVDAWGNQPGQQTLGMIFPADVSPVSPQAWGVVITYDEDGHVKDDDASTINYDNLLKDMKEGLADENKERVKQGYASVQLVGWAEPPRYDQAAHKLYWAKELAFSDSPGHTLNYNIRVLGRKGVLVLNAVAGMDQIGAIKTEMQNVIAFTEFKPGNAYGDFNSSTDHVAEYGIAALVAGGIAAKAGLFAKLIAVLIAAKKLVIVGFVALLAGIKKLLGMKKESAPETRE